MTHVAELRHLFHHGHNARHDSRGVLVRHSHRALEAGSGAGGGGAAATGPGVVATKVLARPAPGRRGSRGRAATGLLVDARHDGGGVLTAGRGGSIGGGSIGGRGGSGRGRGRGLATHHGVHTGHHVIDVTTGRRRSRVRRRGGGGRGGGSGRGARGPLAALGSGLAEQSTISEPHIPHEQEGNGEGRPG